MAEKEKHKVIFSKESILVLLQEIYNELTEQKNIGTLIQNKIVAFMKTPEDTIVMIPAFEKQQKVVNDVIDKKIALAKLQSSLWTKEKNALDDPDNFSIGDVDQELINSLITRNLDGSNDTDNYKLK